MKPPSSLSAHLAPVVRPAGCRFLNYEGEVAVVIGRRCHRVGIDEALDYVRWLHGRQRLGRSRLPARRPRLDAAGQGAGRVLPARPGAGRCRRRRPRRPDVAHVRQRRAGPARPHRHRPDVLVRLPDRRRGAADHARAGRRAADRHARAIRDRSSPATSSRSRSRGSGRLENTGRPNPRTELRGSASNRR